jgi:hypothetical protein
MKIWMNSNRIAFNRFSFFLSFGEVLEPTYFIFALATRISIGSGELNSRDLDTGIGVTTFQSVLNVIRQ